MPPKSSKVTRSSASQKQRQEIHSIATDSSPPKACKTKKSRKQQASFESPVVSKTTPQVVTLQKKKQASSSEDSSNDGNSTGDENASASVTMASNLTRNADSRLDKKLDHVLEEFLLAVGGGHEIRQMFKGEDIYQFANFVGYKVVDIEDLRRKVHNTMKGFNNRKVTLIYNVIRYYNYLGSKDVALAEDPENWAMTDFKKWIRDGCHPNDASAAAASANATLPGATTAPNTTAPTATVCPDTRKAENAWLSWKRSRRDVNKYPIISIDRQ